MNKVIVLSLILTFMLGANALAKITEDDIIALWLFDDGQGDTLTDASGNGHDGKLINGPTWVDGKFGQALEFDSSSQQRVEVPDAPDLNPTDQITIMAWGYLFDTNGNRRFLQKSTPGSDNQYRLLLEWGSFKFDAGPGVSPKEVTTPIFTTNEWHHVAGVYDGAEIALYIDGEKKASMAAKGQMVPSSGPLFIGTKHPNAPEGDYWNGRIDEVVILNRGVTAEEVKEAMKGFTNVLAVDPREKIAVTWGALKRQYQ